MRIFMGEYDALNLQVIVEKSKGYLLSVIELLKVRQTGQPVVIVTTPPAGAMPA
jgi:hypothetical protein